MSLRKRKKKIGLESNSKEKVGEPEKERESHSKVEKGKEREHAFHPVNDCGVGNGILCHIAPAHCCMVLDYRGKPLPLRDIL